MSNKPVTWLDIIDEALSSLLETEFTPQVEEAQLLIQDILNGHAPVEELLRSVSPDSQTRSQPAATAINDTETGRVFKRDERSGG
ncbi:MAG: hypothetical protein BroJett011_42710 [Chloroflexota bacterium]|nr:MAG: hypothetical protein BroJett011_42710 [Chloroflexota bacterium]